MNPFHLLGVAGEFGGSLFSAKHGSLVTSSLIRETTENESANGSEVTRTGSRPAPVSCQRVVGLTGDVLGAPSGGALVFSKMDSFCMCLVSQCDDLADPA